MSQTQPYLVHARSACPDHDEMLRAVAAEFRLVDDRAIASLDALALDVGPVARLAPDAQAAAAARAVFAGGLHRALDPRPERLMLDLVLDGGCGHELVLAVVLAEVGIRAGVPLRPVGVGARTVVAHAGAIDDALVLDPVRRGAPMRPVGDEPVRWLCAHQVAFRLLRGLTCAFQHVGDVTAAIRAAELLLELPLGDRLRSEAELGLARVRARLN